MNIKTLLLYVALLFPQYSTAQQVRDFTYSHIGQEEGLGNQRIYTIRQTDDKALWWSTKEGVDRYNGVSVKHYEIGNSAVFGNYAGRITKLAEVTDGALIAFDNKGGVYDYDKVQDRFVLRIDLSSLFKSDVLLNDLLAVDNGFHPHFHLTFIVHRVGTVCNGNNDNAKSAVISCRHGGRA